MCLNNTFFSLFRKNHSIFSIPNTSHL